MKLIKGKRAEIERQLLEALLTRGAEERAANLKMRLARRGKGKVMLTSDKARDTALSNKPVRNSEG